LGCLDELCRSLVSLGSVMLTFSAADVSGCFLAGSGGLRGLAVMIDMALSTFLDLNLFSLKGAVFSLSTFLLTITAPVVFLDDYFRSPRKSKFLLDYNYAFCLLRMAS
jgi:hypothetical protein